jgi:hypothetical protein
MFYNSFDKFIFRCPILSFNASEKDSNWNDIIKEAILIASPDLYTELTNVKHPLKQEMTLKREYSFLKYKLRMKSRCTPFGLFAGCGIGKIGQKSEIILDRAKCYKTRTRLDMDFLCSLSQVISKMDSVKEKLSYYPNSSLYKILDSYRYIEYQYSGGKRKHYLSEIESNSYLDQIIDFSKNGTKSGEIIEFLLENGFEEENAREYVDELISNQVLVGSMEPTVTGEDLLDRIINLMIDFELEPRIRSILEKVREQLFNIDTCKLGRDEKLYQKVEESIKLLGIDYKRQNLIQTDLFIQPLKASISDKIIESVKKGINTLARLMPESKDKFLDRFREDFYKRYQEEEIPLVEALDPEIGIGFGRNTPGNLDFHPLIDNIVPEMPGDDDSFLLSKAELFLQRKFYECHERGENQINLSDEELSDFTLNLSNLPSTISSVIEVIKKDPDDSTPNLILKYVGGSSAANFINRFSNMDTEFNNYISSIIKKENEIIGNETIIAEIVHLPESRTGNILFRPSFRDYEIPYLAREFVDKEFKIPVTDILVSVKGGKLIRLVSRKLNKEILPILTTAHNFYDSPLPIYSFLCSFQTQSLRSNISFQWSNFLKKEKSLPRVVYKDIILSTARWNFKKNDLWDKFLSKEEDPVLAIKNFKLVNNLPDQVLLVKRDQKLLIDFTIDKSISLFANEVKGQDFILEEFIFNMESAFITEDKYCFRNEVILGFYKTN